MNKVILTVAVALFLGVVSFALFFERVPPATIGVKQNNLVGGIVKRDYDTGYRLGVAVMHKWYLLDKRTHFLTFSPTQPGPMGTRYRPALELRTRDNNSAALDVTVSYRIMPGSAHKMVQEGLKDAYRQRVVSTVESVLREEMANLTSEEFYSTDLRLERAQQALPALRQAMARFYVEPTNLLIRAVRFPVDYERKLQEKQLFYQQALLDNASQKVEEQLQVTGIIEKETERMMKEKQADWDKILQGLSSDNQVAVASIAGGANKYDQATRAEADASYRQMVAEGQLAIRKAEALGAELRNNALHSKGGRLVQAQAAAENLRIDHVTLNSNDRSIPSIIDIDGMVRMLTGTGDH